jgi:hypothetical protein
MLPAFAALYNIRPWEIDLLTAAEIDELIDRLRRPPREEVSDGR